MTDSFLPLICVTIGLAFGQESTCLCHPDIPLIPRIYGVAQNEGKSVSSLTTFGGETLLGWFMRDLDPPFDEVHPYPERYDLLYLRDNEMSAYEKHQIDEIKPGMSFQDLRGFMCENGGLTASGEYYVRNNMRAVAVRIAFRPAGMPEAAFHDPAQRVLWLKQHPDISASDAVVESHSKPFLTTVWFD